MIPFGTLFQTGSFKPMNVNRKNIIETLKSEFINDNTVHAFWLEGADAHETVDEFSDIDIWFDVEDGCEEAFVQHMKKALLLIAPFDFICEKNHSHPKIRQFFIRLKNTSVFLVIDLCLQSHSRKVEFAKENEDEKAKVIFDKSGVIKYININPLGTNKATGRRKKEIEYTFEFFSVWVKKEINRDNFLEALSYYHEYILSPLTEYLRIIYQPAKKDFNLKHIKSDLPPDIVAKLEYLYKISSLKEIEEKTQEAISFFKGVAEKGDCT